MTKPTDDLEAVRVVAEALQGFDSQDQERIIRWAREKLGLVASSALQVPAASGHLPPTATPDIPASSAPISMIGSLETPQRFVVETPELEHHEVDPSAAEQLVLEPSTVERPDDRPVVERLAPKRPTVERPVVVNPPPPTLTPEEKSRRLFTVIGIIVLTVAVALLIFMITSHPK